MATPTTIKIESNPAATKPAAQKHTRKAQCSRGASSNSRCSNGEDDFFFDMDEAGKTADRIIKTAGQMAEFVGCAKQLDCQEL